MPHSKPPRQSVVKHPDRDSYTHTANGRTWKLFGCAKRGCDRINLDFEAYGTRDGKSWCLGHVPLRIRFRRLLGEDV